MCFELFSREPGPGNEENGRSSPDAGRPARSSHKPGNGGKGTNFESQNIHFSQVILLISLISSKGVINSFWLNQKTNQLEQLKKLIESPFLKYQKKFNVKFEIEIFLYLFDLQEYLPLHSMDNFDALNTEVSESPKYKGSIFNLSMVCETSTNCLLFCDNMHSGRFKKKGQFTKFVTTFWNNCRKLLDAPVCLDEHHTDQVILYCCLARGQSRLKTGKLSLHAQAVIELAKRYLKVEVDVIQNEDESCTIVIEGADFSKE